jgi:hypothetical protein
MASLQEGPKLSPKLRDSGGPPPPPQPAPTKGQRQRQR